MRGLALLPLLTAIAFSQTPTAVKRTFTVDGRPVECTVQAFQPPMVIASSPKNTDQKTAINCSRLYFSRLAAGDIAGAVSLSNDPEKVRTRLIAHRDRVGDQEFRKMMGTYFAGGVALKYIITLGERQMLIVHDQAIGADMAQFYVKKAGLWISDDRHVSEMGILAKLFQQLKNDDGIVTIKMK